MAFLPRPSRLLDEASYLDDYRIELIDRSGK